MRTLQLLLFSFVLLIAGCDKNESTSDSITDFDSEQLDQTIYADQTTTSNGGFAFTAKESWYTQIRDISTKSASKAPNSTPTWVKVDPSSGGADTVQMTISIDENNTGMDRVAEIWIISGETTLSLRVEQKAQTREEAGVDDGDTPSENPDIDRRTVRYLSTLDYTYKSGDDDNTEQGTITYTYDEDHFVSQISDGENTFSYTIDRGGHYTNLIVSGNGDGELSNEPWEMTINYWNDTERYGSSGILFYESHKEEEGYRFDYSFDIQANNHTGLDRLTITPKRTDEQIIYETGVWDYTWGETYPSDNSSVDQKPDRQRYNLLGISYYGYLSDQGGMTSSEISLSYSDIFNCNTENDSPLCNIDPNSIVLGCVETFSPQCPLSSLFLAGYMRQWGDNLINKIEASIYEEHIGERQLTYQVNYTFDADEYVTGIKISNNENERWTFTFNYE